jgi:lipid-A-disaccharide synthase
MIILIDVIITTNSPGEVSSWVRPVVDELNKKDIEKNIYVFTPPCVFSSGNEGKVLSNIEGVTNTFNKKEYLKYVLLNIKPKNFNVSKKGFVIFLGGDFMHAVFLGKKLGYPVYSYTERDFGFKKSVKKFYLSDQNIYKKLINNGIGSSKLKVVGNLMYDSINPKLSKKEAKRLLGKKDNDFIINLMPGSRPKEFRLSLPLFLQVAENIYKKNNKVKFIISKSSFINNSTIEKNLKDIKKKYNISYEKNNKILYINDIKIDIYENNLHSIMRESDFAITIPGTNNLELAALNTPMLVLLPLINLN